MSLRQRVYWPPINTLLWNRAKPVFRPTHLVSSNNSASIPLRRTSIICALIFPTAHSNPTLNGAPAYNPREASHMVDVRAVFQAVFRAGQVAFILILLLGFIPWCNGKQIALASAIQSGSVVTSGLVLSIALSAVFSWQVWFDFFHRCLFKDGSWLFDYSDTLIRLFPLKFWSDATFSITTFSLAGALLLAFIGWPGKRVHAAKQA
jgi:integral membrane protein (TIGR01906 family)